MIRQKIGVVLGRFVPLQYGHERMLLEATQENDILLVLIAREGYNRNERTERNPFTVTETQRMINNLSLIGHSRCSNVMSAPIVDLVHSNESTQLDKDIAWSRHVMSIIWKNLITFNMYPESITYYTGEPEHVERVRFAFTTDADKTNMLLPDYGFTGSSPNIIKDVKRDDLSATMVRDLLASGGDWKKHVNPANHEIVEKGWRTWEQQ